MKKGFIVVLVAMLAFGGSAMAQKNIKLGHINSNELMQIMPGRDTAMAQLQKDVEDAQAEMDAMKKEYESKVNEYMAKRDQYYVVHITGIDPVNMDNIITVSTDRGDIVFTANTIAKIFAGNANANLATLAKALYLYGAAANEYFV